MKTLLIPLICLGACVQQPPKKITIVAAPEPPRKMGLRMQEQVQEYRLGRYIDKRNLMHEAHPVYRIEHPATWNLAGTETTSNATTANDAVIAETNKQARIAKFYAEQHAKVAEMLGNITSKLTDTKDVAADNLQLKTEIAVLEKRLRDLEAKLRTSAANQAPIKESNW
jgi:polyhydroxyalkanoate synthesis regulator phasin